MSIQTFDWYYVSFFLILQMIDTHTFPLSLVWEMLNKGTYVYKKWKAHITGPILMALILQMQYLCKFTTLK